MERRRWAATAVAGILAATGLSACAGEKTRPSDEIVIWSLEAQPDRIAAQKKMLSDFTGRTGVKATLVAVDEAQLPQLIAGAAQTGDLPDLVGGLPLGFMRQLDSFGVLDRTAATKVMNTLGRDTFAPATLRMTSEGEESLAVPSDGWAQILVYRKDLFAQAGLAPPTTYAALTAAAKKLTTGRQFGISIATDPADAFTQQTFESLALGNGCQLVDGEGKAQLTSPACERTWDTYSQLTGKVSPEGTQDVDTTRASYFAGQSAMVLWSTFILDELGGLRKDALPTCGPCKKDPTWLAKNSGVVTRIAGPDDAKSGGFAEVGSWAILKDRNTAGASAFVRYAMTEGYRQWLSISPEGKYPARYGPTKGSRAYVQQWNGLKAGVDSKKQLSSIYTPETMRAMSGIWDHLDRWAIPQGQGKVLGPTSAELPVPKAVAAMANGSMTPREAAQDANDAVDEIATSAN